MNHRWGRTFDANNPAPVEWQYIPLFIDFTGFLYVPGGAEFLPSTVPPYVVCRLSVSYLYFLNKTLTLDELLGWTWRMVDVPSTLDHLGARCTILADLWVWAKYLLRRGLTPSPQTPLRFEPKKREDWENTFWFFQQKTNRLCYGCYGL